jgi:acetoin utilization deacetylase AcuC-like enzyme
MLIIYSPRCLEYAAAGHPESPERIRATRALLEKESHTWLAPEPCSEQDILRVHSPAMLEALKSGSFSDPDTPYFANIYELARLSAGAAILASEKALQGEPAFSLMRPPGHHAERDRIMGFCYFNNIAIAVAKVLEENPRVQKVAILDFDCHHGNGTEAIFRGDERVLFVSLHQSPCYPGTGLRSAGNIVNYPLPPGTTPDKFMAALDSALGKIAELKPDLLAISAGFDAYKHDPITQMGLEIETYRHIGAHIAKLGPLPAFAVLEGGYAPELPECVSAFVDGWVKE